MTMDKIAGSPMSSCLRSSAWAGSKDAERVDWILVERKEELELDPRTNEIRRGKISVFYWDLSAETASDIPDDRARRRWNLP